MIAKLDKSAVLYTGQYGFGVPVNDCAFGSRLMAKEAYQSFMISARVALLIAASRVSGVRLWLSWLLTGCIGVVKEWTCCTMKLCTRVKDQLESVSRVIEVMKKNIVPYRLANPNR